MIFENIKKKCGEKNISIYTLERETGIGNGVIAKWQYGSPRVESIQKVANYFGCTVDDLLKEN